MKRNILLLLILLHQICYAQWKQKDFFIGTFADPRITYDHDFQKDSLSFSFAKDAYINLLTGPQYYMGGKDFSMMDRTLRLAEKFNMKLLVIDSRLQITNPSFNVDIARKIISHFDSLNSKAFEGYYFGGEFPEKDAHILRKWTAFFKKNSPGKLAYSYLLPQYAFLTKGRYEDYLNKYLTSTTNSDVADVVSVDYYPFTKSGTLRNTFFYNMDILRRRAGDKPLWSYILSTSTPNYSDPTEYQLNFSVFCSIAYGAKAIIYFTYETIPERYNLKYGDAIIDKNGKPTPKYAFVKKINEYVTKVLAPIVMNNQYISTYHASKYSENEILADKQLINANSILSNIDNNSIIIGLFQSRAGTHYIIAVNKSKDFLAKSTISLKGNFTATLLEYSRMGMLAKGVQKNPILSIYKSGNTVFQLANIKPGEAILIEF